MANVFSAGGEAGDGARVEAVDAAEGTEGDGTQGADGAIEGRGVETAKRAGGESGGDEGAKGAVSRGTEASIGMSRGAERPMGHGGTAQP